MRRIFLFAGMSLALGMFFSSRMFAAPIDRPELTAGDNREEMPFKIYTDAGAPDNHYTPSGWMGDTGDLETDDQSEENPQQGTTCIKVSYSARGKEGNNWAGIYWQHPHDNWGSRDGGYDLGKARRLTFWARGARNGVKIDKFGVGGIRGEVVTDSSETMIGPVRLSTAWRQYSVDLRGRNLSKIIGGFMFALNVKNNRRGAVFYLDDIRFE